VSGRFSSFREGLDRRARATIAGTGVLGWGLRLTSQYNLLFASDLGASAFELGLLNGVAGAVSSLASVPLGWAAERYSVRGVMLAGYACTALAAAIFALANDWWMLIPAFVIGSRLVRVMPLADIILVSATEPGRRAGVMSLSRVVWGALNVFAPITAALVVAHFGGINARGIRPLYYLQLVLTVSALLFMVRMLEPLQGGTPRSEESSVSSLGGLLQDYGEFFRGERWLGRWVAVRMVRQFGMSLAVPFVPLWLVGVKGATPGVLGLMGTAGIVVALLLQIPVGRLADMIGRKKAFFILRPVAYLGTLLMILAPDPGYLVLVGVLGAVAWGGGGGGGGGGIGGVSATPFVTMFWEAVPREKRGRWFGVEGLMSLATIPASLLGGYLWQRGFMAEVLLAPVLLEVLVAMPILATVPDTLARPEG
jgi:MFS family permease